MSRPVRIAVIGCGLVARRSHLPTYLADPEAELSAVVSGRIETARTAAAEFGGPRVLPSWQEAVADSEIDAIDICTPNALHAVIAIAAAHAGKHVLVEKPMALSLADADAMIAAAREAGVVLMVAHNLRYAPVYEAIKRTVSDGVIGELLAARGVFMHAGPDSFWGASSDWFWREETAGGGSLLDLGIHMIDLLRWFIDRPVIEVSALMARLQKPTFADDNAIVIMRFAGDVLASLQTSWTALPSPESRVIIHGTRGHLEMNASAPQPLTIRLSESGEQRVIVPDLPATSSRVNPFVHFVRCILDGTPPLTSGEEARASLAVALAAYESARSGSVVRIAV
jgi:UDP-N-acetylglucosamine 3-dehydrogenase